MIAVTTTIIEQARFKGDPGYPSGIFRFDDKTGRLQVIVSVGFGWDHVSISKEQTIPSWEDMCQIKDLFFKPSETVMQLHVPDKDHINTPPHCLHLWRPQTKKEIARANKRLGRNYKHGDVSPPGKVPLPPKWMV